jgi:hypothetical protein
MHRGIPMRTLMKVQMDTEAASEAIRNGTMQATLESVMEQLNLEAAYFTAEGGQRTARTSSSICGSRPRSRASLSPSSSPSRPRSICRR